MWVLPVLEFYMNWFFCHFLPVGTKVMLLFNRKYLLRDLIIKAQALPAKYQKPVAMKTIIIAYKHTTFKTIANI